MSLRFSTLNLPTVAFSQPERLPAAPGIYLVLIDIQLTAGRQCPDRIPHVQPAVRDAIATGKPFTLCLYVGQSTSIYKRWTAIGARTHHKKRCILVMSALLSTFCNVARLRIGWGRIVPGKGLKRRLDQAEAATIAGHQPILNGLAPISKTRKRKIRR